MADPVWEVGPDDDGPGNGPGPYHRDPDPPPPYCCALCGSDQVQIWVGQSATWTPVLFSCSECRARWAGAVDLLGGWVWDRAVWGDEFPDDEGVGGV